MKTQLFFLILCISLLQVTARESQEIEYCDNKKGQCINAERDIYYKKLLLYDVNPPEGFNLRRDVYMRFAIMLAEAQKREEYMDWHLVLPPWHAIYHWKLEYPRGSAKPWNMFFDISSMNSYVPVLELHQVMQNSGKYGLKIDSLYVLQNYDNPFEDGDFTDKWSIDGPCEYSSRYWGYHNITAGRVICVKFQGCITQLWEIIKLHPDDKKIMFYHAEIPLHSNYGTKSYWDCRKSMQFNSDLVDAADNYISKKLGCVDFQCTNYISVHWRRQDFSRANRTPSIKGTVEQIHNIISKKALNIKDVFVATDGTEQEIKLLQKHLQNSGFNAHFYEPDLSKYLDGQIAIIEQIICSRGAFFIGTHESTFTYRIQEEREIIGFDSDTTFNRLCPDVGECEEPSRWTIVH